MALPVLVQQGTPQRLQPQPQFRRLLLPQAQHNQYLFHKLVMKTLQ
jgi:hypothetical protein